MIWLGTALLLTLTGAATGAALLMRAHLRSVTRLTEIIVSERASSEQRLQTILEQHASERRIAHPNLTELIAQIDRLCQRIQSPQQAVIDHSINTTHQVDPALVPPPIIPDDDADFWEKRNLGPTKEQLAEMIMAEETHGG